MDVTNTRRSDTEAAKRALDAFLDEAATSQNWLFRFSHYSRAEEVLSLPPGTLVALAIEAQRRLASLFATEWHYSDPRQRHVYALLPALRTLAGQKLLFTNAEIRVLVDTVPHGLSRWACEGCFVLPAAAISDRLKVDPSDADVLRECRRFLSIVERPPKERGERNDKWARRVRQMLGVETAGSTVHVFQDGDVFGRTMRAFLERGFIDEPGVRELIALAGGDMTSKQPTSKWRRECARLLSQCPRAEELVRTALDPLRTSYVGANNTESAKALMWMLPELRPAWAPKLLADLAIHYSPGASNQKLANAAVLILGELGDRAAVGQLARARLKIRNRGTRKQIDQALATASAKAGIPTAELLEMCVPDFGLGSDGRKAVGIGDVTAVVEVAAPAEVRLAWRDSAGAELKAAPASIKEAHKDEIAALKADVKEIRATLGTERARLEDLLAGTRTWPVPIWTERYVRHPVTGPVARGLLWSVSIAGGARCTGLVASADGALTGVDGVPFAVDLGADVRLWHPINSTPDEIEAWRRRIVNEEIVQPLKQAFREVYVLTPAEEQTRVYSNRFAGHVLRYRQASALMKARLWHANALGGWDGGYEGIATKDFPDQGMRAEFFHDAVPDDGGQGDVVHCTTDQVRFFAARGGQDPVALADVPPLVFSEAMRDVDLFVSVASVAADPNWTDRGENRNHFDAWTAAAFGELQESAKIRRDALLRIVPKLRIASRCTVEERWLVVRGDLATYRIHLGSANIQMEPGSRYLCIVVDRGASRTATSRVYLPFEEDGTLSVILSKAFLLADDRKIKDETILRQIRSVG